MDTIKVGKFISECRKKKELTQSALAEKLNVTDRAVSKWERGLSLPDASIMLDLCNILDITVNDLLMGEKVSKKEVDKVSQELLLEMAHTKEIYNKKLFIAMWVLLIVDILYYSILVFGAALIFGEGTIFNLIMNISTIIFIVIGFIALKFEVDSGYYECKNCHDKFVPSYKEVVWSFHMATARYLKCPKCNKKTWTKKVLK